LIIALAYNKRRFYAFSHHDPLLNEEQAQNRDILNEAPDASDLLEASHLAKDNDFSNATLTTATTAILRTTHGDITIKLFPKETPKTIENFIGHAQSGYYDNVIFHRIIQGFMLQTGDPLGDGTGGESIWGGEFSTATYATLFVLL
jgi:peptidylprolyl isomerase domain and WD repeat-containing protein 1